MPFIYVCCLTVASTFDTKSDRSDECGYPCLVSDLRGKTFNVLLLSITTDTKEIQMIIRGYCEQFMPTSWTNVKK